MPPDDTTPDPTDEGPDALLAQRFETARPGLRAVAFQVLGSGAEADDAVQEAWFRLARTGGDGVDNLGGWLRTVVVRVCLDMLRSRRSRREDLAPTDDLPDGAGEGHDPEQQAVLADAVGPAMLVVLDTLSPAERLAFVLHDVFAVPFDEIAPLVDRSPAATRQLASRARRRVQGAPERGSDDIVRRRRVVAAFLAASRDGDFSALLTLLDPAVVLRADAATVAAAAAGAARGAPALAPEVHGPTEVATVFSGRARAARPALIDGWPGAAWAPRGVPAALFVFDIEDDVVVEVLMIGGDDVARHHVELLRASS